MKRLVCELCGSNDIIRDGEFFVCQSCGTKYTLESARKIILEGTVRLDVSELVHNSLVNARRAKKNEDWEETERYYNNAEEYSPDNIEAIFYSSYGRARKALMGAELSKKINALTVLSRDIALIDDYFDASCDEQMTLIENISRDIMSLCDNGFFSEYSYDKDVLIMFSKIHKSFINTLEHITEDIPADDRRYERLHRIEEKHLKAVMEYDITGAEKRKIKEKLASIVQTLDSEYSTTAQDSCTINFIPGRHYPYRPDLQNRHISAQEIRRVVRRRDPSHETKTMGDEDDAYASKWALILFTFLCSPVILILVAHIFNMIVCEILF